MQKVVLHIPQYQDAYRLLSEGKITFKGSWRFTQNPVDKDKSPADYSSLIRNHDNNKITLTLPKDTVIQIRSINVRRSYSYESYIAFYVFHDRFKGLQYKTVDKLSVYLWESDGFKQLSDLELEQLDAINF